MRGYYDIGHTYWGVAIDIGHDSLRSATKLGCDICGNKTDTLVGYDEFIGTKYLCRKCEKYYKEIGLIKSK